MYTVITVDTGDVISTFDSLCLAKRQVSRINRACDRRVVRVVEPETYELRLALAPECATRYASRAAAELALVEYAKGVALDWHLHPGDYTDTSCSTAFAFGGDMFLDAAAVLRRVF